MTFRGAHVLQSENSPTMPPTPTYLPVFGHLIFDFESEISSFGVEMQEHVRWDLIDVLCSHTLNRS